MKTGERKISKHHPFYKWKKGTKLSQLTCVAVDVRDGVSFVELTNRDLASADGETDESNVPPTFIASVSELLPGMKLPVVITSVSQRNTGIWVELSPGISGFIPAFELSSDPAVLNNLSAYYPIGARVECCVMEKKHWTKTERRGNAKSDDKKTGDQTSELVYLSVLQVHEKTNDGTLMSVAKPLRGDLIVGRINRKTHVERAPALMLDIRGGFVGRCCITELEEVDDWTNMPLGRIHAIHSRDKTGDHNIVTDEEHDAEGDTIGDDKMDVDEDSDDEENGNSR